MIFENEKKLLKIIKYSPTIFILTISILILSISFFENKKNFEKERNKIRQEYTLKNKEIIKQRVYEVHKYIKREQELTENDLKDSLQEAINNAYSIALTIYENNLDKSEEEVKQIIKDALRNIRFNDGRGYYFVYETNGKNVLLPHNRELEGKDFWNHQDAKGTYIIKDMTNLLSKNDEAFYEWYWFNPVNPDVQRKKIGLIKNFKPFNWFIGTGEYVEDFEKEIQKRVLENIKEIRFGNNGYIFIINYDSVYLSHIRKNYIGKKAVTNNDTVEIRQVIEDLIEISKNGEGFYSYIQNKKPDNNQPIKKISFVKGLNEWSWMIGTGFYEDDMQKSILAKKLELEKEFEDYVYSTIKYSALLIFILFLISLYFTKVLQRRFKKYQEEINQHLKEKSQQQSIIAQQSKMAAMGEMIGNIAHQWRQPLSTITTTSTGLLLQKEMNILDDKFLISGLNGINTSAQYLSNTIDDFRNFFKSDKEKKEFSVQESLDKAICLVHAQFYYNEIRIVKNDEDAKINSFENEFIQVVINLLNNSRDELIKKDKDYKKFVFLDVKNGKKSVQISIKDNAGGIDKNIINRVFEPYFTTKHKSQGTGIGLFMSSEIISKNMKGSISAKNVEYEYLNNKYSGAEFTIKLPKHHE